MEVGFVPLDASAVVSGTLSTSGVGFVPRGASPVVERNVVRAPPTAAARARRSPPRRSTRARTGGRERCGGCVSGRDHTGADGVVRSLVDEDERARYAVGGVGLDRQRAGDAEAHAADVVERKPGGGRGPLRRGEVEPV